MWNKGSKWIDQMGWPNGVRTSTDGLSVWIILLSGIEGHSVGGIVALWGQHPVVPYMFPGCKALRFEPTNAIQFRVIQ